MQPIKKLYANLKGNNMQILKGHTSPETAYLVENYPYGYTLRCKIRYWLEYNPSFGIRFCSQTTNPKKSFEFWNKPKKSTYASISACMYLNEIDHVHWSELTNYSSYQEAFEWKEKFFDGVPVEALERLNSWIEGKRRYEEKQKNGMDWKEAGRETALEMALRNNPF
jgi:hypothetical protein